MPAEMGVIDRPATKHILEHLSGGNLSTNLVRPRGLYANWLTGTLKCICQIRDHFLSRIRRKIWVLIQAQKGNIEVANIGAHQIWAQITP